MKTNYMKKTWMHLVLAVSLIGALTTVAYAETFSIEVPFAFEAGGKTFPAGAYTVDSVASGVLVIRGATERLTPILMTALATGLALLPLALTGNKPGQEIEYPLAVVILGGLVTSTLLNLLLLPPLYAAFGRPVGKRVDEAA